MDNYQLLFDFIALENLQMRAEHWILTHVLAWSSLAQIVASLVGLGVAYVTSRPLREGLRRYLKRHRPVETMIYRLADAAISVVFPLFALVILTAIMGISASYGWPHLLVTTCVNLLAAWIVIRLISATIRSDFWSRLIGIVAFGIATLNILGLLEPTIGYLDEIGIRLGNTHLSVLDMLKGGVELAVLLWLALTASRLLEQRVQRAQSLTPSLRVLAGKLVRFSLIVVAVVIALTSVGIDLTAFAVFTGALGVGIGFGLQKPISNLLSGLILLLDRSIKPGDVVELGDPGNRSIQLFGWVTALNARYASLTTRDGTEWLVPNEDLITKRVINWSYADNRLRLLTPFGVSFDCDVRMAMQLAEEAAKETPRVLSDPAPVCRLMGFGDSSADLELRFWIEDPTNGVINVRSQVLLTMWEKFREHGIRTPLGHRDLHIKGDSSLTVKLSQELETAA